MTATAGELSRLDPDAGSFPPGFRWGAATAAYQVEGAATEDGRGPSIWDTFAAVPGHIADGSDGLVACDHYHRWREDVDLLNWLGVSAYRFSLSWPRILPGGGSRIESRGLDFYDRLVDGLLAQGIDPVATLYHWDLPQPLEDAGGWPERDTASRFVDLALAAYERLGDRVSSWITLNEPWCSAFLGYASGVHAPGRREPAAALRATHHLLLAHGLAVTAMREAGCTADIGITVNLYPVHAASDEPADVDAARRLDGMQNRIFLDPVLRGRYPADVLADLEARGYDHDYIAPGDLEVISTPIDMLGVNYYSSFKVRAADGAGAPHQNRPGMPWVGCDDIAFVSRQLPLTHMDWEVDPDGLRQMLLRLAHEYDCPPLMITENGAAYRDEAASTGEVDDPERIAFVESHLRAALAAISEGVPLRAYFLWSLLDNLEWAWGYSRRFGVVHVDFATQKRTPKSSAYRYREIVAANGLGPVS
jgi:beta-glucosidase